MMEPRPQIHIPERLRLTSNPPTPSMTDGRTYSDVSLNVPSEMSSTLQQKLHDRRLELGYEGPSPHGDEGFEKSSDEDARSSISSKGRRKISKVHKVRSKSGTHGTTISGRRVVSLASTRRGVPQMGSREQEEVCSFLIPCIVVFHLVL